MIRELISDTVLNPQVTVHTALNAHLDLRLIFLKSGLNPETSQFDMEEKNAPRWIDKGEHIGIP